MIDILRLQQTAIDLAQAGGQVLKEHWGKTLTIQEKAFPGDLVTEVDRESENIIFSLLHDRFPAHAILSEESGMQEVAGSEYLWVIDPLDGTTNYTHSYPFVCVAVGLLYQGDPIIGVVYNPIHDELFAAGKGLGTTCNGRKISVSQTATLHNSLLATGFAYDRNAVEDNNYAEFCHMTSLSQGVRRGGAAALDLAYVAAGRLDGFWEKGLQPWDIAAGAVLIAEAEGTVSDYDLSPLDLQVGRIIGTNGTIHQELSQKLLSFCA